MPKFRAVVKVGGILYEGERRSDPERAKAAAARMALGRLGIQNGSYISNFEIRSILEQYCKECGLPQPSYVNAFSNQWGPLLKGIPEGICWLGHPCDPNVVKNCSSLLQRVCENLGVTDCSTGVQAAIIMENTHGPCDIICAAKGNAFISDFKKLENCRAIRDCHAEILARRGLILFLLQEMVKVKRGAIRCCVMQHSQYKYTLRRGVKFHLYVSKVPCGDAAVPDGDGHLRYVKAHGQGEILTREPDGLYKMSCSDKIALWNVVGVQGALLSKILTEPIFLSSIFIGSVEKRDGKSVEDIARSVERDAKRAFVDRLSGQAHHPPHIEVLRRSDDSETKPKAICWVANDDGLGQVIETSTGLPEKGDTDVSKYNFFKLWTEITGCKGTYGGYKSGAKQYQTEKEGLMKFFSSNGKGKWTHKPQNADDFSL
jgi:hypothetical protein